MRVTILFDNFGPYHFARVGSFAKRAEVVGIELRSRSRTYSWQPEQKTDFEKRTLPPVPRGSYRQEAQRLTPHLEAALADSRPEVLAVNGWGDFLAVQSIRWARRRRIPIVLMSESSRLDGPSSPAKDFLKRRIVGTASSGLVGGSPHRDYLIELGMHRDRVFTGYNAVDNEFFSTESARCRQKGEVYGFSSGVGCPSANVGTQHSECQSFKIQNSQFAIEPRPYFLASNRFIKRKNLQRLIEAYGLYAQTAQKLKSRDAEIEIWNLCLLGDGELKPTLIDLCQKLGLRVLECTPWENQGQSNSVCADAFPSFQLSAFSPPTVFFPGFRQLHELPRFYAHAGCFIHPALEEPWGLVVNEAMASGLPVLVSNRCGCADDLVAVGRNGFTFNPESVREISQCLQQISAPDFPREQFAAESERIIAAYSPDVFADGMQKACLTALANPVQGKSMFDTLLLEVLCKLR